jgi:hypothetical protein
MIRNSMSMKAILLLAIILTSALLFAKPPPVLAQSVPEFTLRFEAYPYDEPPVYGIDPYTGKNVTVQEGYHVRNESTVFTIKNQPATNLFYNVRYKGYFDAGGWTQLFSYSQYSTDSLRPQSGYYGNTVISIPAVYPFVDGAKVDFQVEALLWHYIDVWIIDHPMAPPPINEIGHYEQRFTLDRTSGWSNTQTMTFPEILPTIALLTPEQSTYNSSLVPLKFTVDQTFTLIKYSLDGQENVTIAGNTTLTGLTSGYHNVTVYATNEAGKTGASETFFFGVEVPEPFPTTLLIVSVIAVVTVVGLGLLVYFKKRQSQKYT